MKFGAQENGVSFGRYPDGAAEWSRLGVPTFGTNNAAPLVSPVGFNEIMYHPLVGGDDAQYVELFNHGTNVIGLGGWKLGGGISWTFASNQVLVAGGYLVIGRNTSYLLANYAQLNAANTAGNFSGKLSGAGERLTLTMPDTILSTNGSGVATTNYLDIVVDEVTYGTGGRWGCWSDGGGSSLELIDARASGGRRTGPTAMTRPSLRGRTLNSPARSTTARSTAAAFRSHNSVCWTRANVWWTTSKCGREQRAIIMFPIQTLTAV